MMNSRNKSGFTIMEVLLALVISCIVMVASVPILTVQKNYGHIEKWNRSQNGADVFYGSPKDSLKVGIGTTTPRARLHVRGYEDRPRTPVMTIRAANNTGVHSVNLKKSTKSRTKRNKIKDVKENSGVNKNREQK